jgi:hypothetical protein
MISDHYSGKLDLGLTYGSPMLHRSINNYDSWKLNSQPFSLWELYEIGEEGYVLLREPNSCFPVDTIHLVDGITIPPIYRTVQIPKIAGVETAPPAGEYIVNSQDDFTFTITMFERDLLPIISTDRRIISDTEGITIIPSTTRNGIYTVIIHYIQEPVHININLTTANVETDGNKVWADNNQLYISSRTSGLVRVYNETGHLVTTLSLASGQNISTTLSSGLYFIKIPDGKSYKIVVK